MNRKAVSGIMLTLLLVGMLTSAFSIQTARAEPTTIIVPDDYPIIQEAINNANEGDTIYVRAGTYYVRAGTYHEHVAIKKSLILTGENSSTTIIDGDGTGSPIRITANSVTISGLKIQNSKFVYLYSGIRVDGCNYNNITGNILTNNFDGIFLTYSSNNTICNNTIFGNNWNGIHLKYYSNYNVIASNTVLNNRNGINLEAHSNNNYLIQNYIASHEWDGIDLTGSQSDSIKGNTITNCFTGIYLGSETDNINAIYHNNFINNMYQVTCYSAPNMWDDGYPSGGNYWSDYAGVDLYSGPYQNETGSDGIWDHTYVIDGNNQDNYPLVKPWGPIKTVFNVTWNEEIYPVTVVSNSTVTDFNFSQSLKQISFNVTGPNGSTGFCNVTIPKVFLRCETLEDWQIKIDDTLITDFIVTENETHTSLYFTYTHTTHQIKIIGTKVIGEEEKTLLGKGWGWMRIAPREYVYGRAELYKIGDTQIELVITCEGETYSRTWNIIFHREYKYGERYLCYSEEWGFLIVGLHKDRWQFWYAVGKGVIAIGFYTRTRWLMYNELLI